MKKIEITKENYKDYIKLYKEKDRIDKKVNKFGHILKIIEFLIGFIIGMNIPISTVDIGLFTEIIIGILFAIEWVLIADSTIHQKIKEAYQTKKNWKLEEEFPNINTKIKTEELVENLIMKNIMSRKYVKSEKYRKKGKYQITIHEEKFLQEQDYLEQKSLQYQDYLEQLSEQKRKEKKKKQKLIDKYNDIKKQVLSESTNLDCPLLVPEEELKKAKNQVKKLVKNRKQ